MRERHRVLALGGFRIEAPDADRALGRGLACELLALLVASRGSPLTTEAIVSALWLRDAPPTAPTMVHASVARVRKAVGRTAVRRDLDGYLLDPAAVTVDLWEAQDLVAHRGRGALLELIEEPVLGPYRERPWARRLVLDVGLGPGGGQPDLEGPGLLPVASRLLTAPLDRLVGRRAELAALRGALLRSRLATVVGLGGVGKSRLVAEVVVELTGAGTAVVRVDLGRATGSFAERLASRLDLVSDGAPGALLLAASAVLDEGSVVVIDACEHDLDGAADGIAFLLQHRPGLRVIATSRSALGVPGEQVIPLLPFTDPTHPRSDAVELLLDRLRSAGFPLTPADRDRAAQLCGACGGVPLAIELVASDYLMTEVPPVTTEGPETLVRDRVRDAVSALGDEAAATAGRLALLPGGASSDLLRRLHPQAASAGSRALLAAAVASIEVTASGRRVHLSDVVRQELDRRIIAEDRSAVAAALIAIMAPASYTGDDWPPVATLEVAADEVANAASLLTALARSEQQHERLDLALAAVGAWYGEGHWIYAVEELQAALGAVEASEGSAASDGPGAVRRARVLASILDVCGTFDAVVPWVAQIPPAAAAAEAAHQGHLVARLRYAEAVGLGYSGRVADSARAANAARVAAEAVGSESLVLRVDGLEAMGQLLVGRPEVARAGLLRTADRCRELGWPGAASTAMLIASFAARAAGHPQDALVDAEVGAELAARGRLRPTHASLLAEIAALRMEVDPLSARQALLAAIEVGVPAGQRRMASVCRLNLGLLDDDLGTLALATSELLYADRRWAGAALAQVATRLPPSHPVRRLASAAVPRLVSEGGAPLLAELEATAASIGAEPAAQLPPDWEAQLHDELTHLEGR